MIYKAPTSIKNQGAIPSSTERISCGFVYSADAGGDADADACNVARVSCNITVNTCNITRNTCNITPVRVRVRGIHKAFLV